MDVTPLALGIRAVGADGAWVFSELISANTTIPAARSETYTTTRDGQTSVNVEVFNGTLDQNSKIGQFKLTGIPPTEKGVPQIDVRFDIDSNCVLTVTARDQGTEQTKSISITDTTLLPPAEIADLTRRYERQRHVEEQRRELDDARAQLRQLAAAAVDNDSMATWQEFRQHQAAHRPPERQLDPESRQLLIEMFNESNQVELDVQLATEAVRRLARLALAHLARPVPDSTGIAAELERTTRLVAEFHRQASVLRQLTTRVVRWIAVLIRLAIAEPDPLRRFRHLYAAGSYRQALDAVTELPEPPTDPADIRRQARCLAEVGDVDGYRTLLRDKTPNRPLGGLVTVRVIPEDGIPVSGTGFLVQDRTVVTSRSWLGDPTTGEPVAATAIAVDAHSTHGTRTVERVQLAATDSDLAVLHLSAPLSAALPPLGYATLVRVGDRVQVPVPTEDPETVWTWRTGVIDRFESSPGSDALLFRSRLQLPPSCIGGPMVNELGEIVGMVTVPRTGTSTDDATFLLAVDASSPVLPKTDD